MKKKKKPNSKVTRLLLGDIVVFTLYRTGRKNRTCKPKSTWMSGIRGMMAEIRLTEEILSDRESWGQSITNLNECRKI